MVIITVFNKHVNILQRSSVKNKYCKKRVEAKVSVYMCL